MSFKEEGHSFTIICTVGTPRSFWPVCTSCRELIWEGPTSAPISYVEQHLAHRSTNPRSREDEPSPSARYDHETLSIIANELGMQPDLVNNANIIVEVQCLKRDLAKPIDMILFCPSCHERHIDEGDFATRVHKTHACQHCGFAWKPSKTPTRGVRFLERYKNEEPSR